MSLPAIGNVTDVVFTWTSPNLRIDWTGTGTNYSVRYHDGTTDVWGSYLTGGDDTGITISGLTEGKYYEFEVITYEGSDAPPRALLLTGYSQPDYYGYTIPQGLTAPTECQIVEQSATQVTIQFKGPNGTWDYVVTWVDEFGEDTGQQTITTQANTVEATITGLIADRNYKIYTSIKKGDEVVRGCYLDKSAGCGCP